MIPSDIRLYTWVDAQEWLLRLRRTNAWPEWLVSIQVYWDALELAVQPGCSAQAVAWVAEVFEPRFQARPPAIELESTGHSNRLLPVQISETEEPRPDSTFRPTLAQAAVLGRGSAWDHPPALPESLPPVVAFHSFKGGVGRTVHALAFAAVSLRREGRSVLLVDADLEAPGLTWFFRERFPNPPISFVDLLSLVHGDTDPAFAQSLELVTDRLRGSQIDGLYVLPAFRSTEQFTSFEVRPEHLVQFARDPFILTSMLARLGKSLNASAVVVDLRAGLSEMAAGLLLDPRVHRVLVTTTSSQSVQGTVQLLRLLGEVVPSRGEEEPLPALILSQIPETTGAEEVATQVEELLLQAGESLFLGHADVDRPPAEAPRLRTPFESSLLVLPESWDRLVSLLEGSRIVRELATLVDWIPMAPVAGSEKKPTRPKSHRDHRKRLADFAERLVYAESGAVDEFLVTAPLKNLASDFRAKVPIVVVAGSKGAGKTFTFLQAIQRGTWQEFVRDAGVADPSVAAFLCPVLASSNLEDSANSKVRQALELAVAKLGLGRPSSPHEIRDRLRSNLKRTLHEGEWRDVWMDMIAWSVGAGAGREAAGRELTHELYQRGQSVVAVIDGLEDLFQDFSSDPAQQIALRALLQDVPDWLSQQPGQALGLAVFVRRDMVLSAVRQNPAQLLAKYEPYALRWDADEALRLVAWICTKAGVLPESVLAAIEEADRRQLVETLSTLWGRKLGGPKSREALSADWVIFALSDLKGQIQARDLVRFLYEAAKGSVADTFWKDRILVPAAIKAAVERCSGKKIDEISQEDPRIGEIFRHLRSLPEPVQQIPFRADQVNLTLADLKTLEDNGAVQREGDEYYMPEIFRSGLQFKLKAGARPRVMTMARRARR
jgi:MinD-like ATPase involved in chromosome partitioning or flagellar assembly